MISTLTHLGIVLVVMILLSFPRRDLSLFPPSSDAFQKMETRYFTLFALKNIAHFFLLLSVIVHDLLCRITESPYLQSAAAVLLLPSQVNNALDWMPVRLTCRGLSFLVANLFLTLLSQSWIYTYALCLLILSLV